MSVSILDGFGREAVYSPRPGDSWPEGAHSKTLKISRPSLRGDMARMISNRKHKMLSDDARYIYTTYPLVAGAVKQKADYVSSAGWMPEYMGGDTEWGLRAQQRLRERHKLVTTRGWSFQKMWHVGCTMWDADTDWFVVLRRDKAGLPRFQPLESWRVGQRHYGDLVSDSNISGFNGLRIFNGIIYDDNAKMVGCRVLGARPDADRDIPARDIIHVANPSFFSDGRPFPTIAYSVLHWYDSKQIDQYRKTKLAVNSALTIVESNAEGRRPQMPNQTAGSAGNTTSDQHALETELFEEGLVRYIRHGRGAITAHESKSPSIEEQQFSETIVKGAFYGMGWRMEMLDLDKLKGAGFRAFQDQINRTIQQRWEDLVPFAVRCVQWEVASLIDAGELPEAPDWWAWGFPQPLEFTVDRRHSIETDLTAVRAGGFTIPRFIRKYYRLDADQVLKEQAEYLQRREQHAADYGVSETDLGTLRQPGDPEAEPDGDAAAGGDDDQ